MFGVTEGLDGLAVITKVSMVGQRFCDSLVESRSRSRDIPPALPTMPAIYRIDRIDGIGALALSSANLSRLLIFDSDLILFWVEVADVA